MPRLSNRIIPLSVCICLFAVQVHAAADEPTDAPPIRSQSTGQRPLSKGWSLDLAGTATVSPGLGEAATAGGGAAAITLVRTRDLDESGGHGCLGVTALFVRTWDHAFSGDPGRSEQWFLAGPRWDHAEPGEPYAFLHIVGGVKDEHAAGGIGLGIGVPNATVGRHPLAWRGFEVNFLVAPGASRAPYRLMIASGVELSLRLTRKR